MNPLTSGFMEVLQPTVLLWIFAGVLLGYVVGALPGLGKGAATAVAIPLTFYIQPVAAISFLVGISKGASAGGAVSAILLNTPGEASSAPTAFDGYPLARQGKAPKALKMALFASVIGDVLGTLTLIVFAEWLARYALLIGPVELTAIILFALTFIAVLSSQKMTRGLVSAALGILLATIGTEQETGIPRLTFGSLDLFDGVSVATVAIGMLAAAEMIRQAANSASIDLDTKLLTGNKNPDDRKILRAEWRACLAPLLRGSLIGIVIGILPGLGSTVASFLSYGDAKRRARDSNRFGRGAIEGVAAAESADNAVVPAAFLPLFALGIPGNVISAILMGAFLMHGVVPGPLIFTQAPTLIYGIYAGMLVASVCMLLIGYGGLRIFTKMMEVPLRYIIPIVLFLCAVGTYLEGDGIFDVGVMVVFAVLGFLFVKFDYSFVTFLIGFVLAPSFELALRQSIAITDGRAANLVNHPIAVVFLVLSLAAVIGTMRSRRKTVRPRASEAEA